MGLTKVSIKNFRIFKDFSWSASLLPFSKKNLIYGWNGTGKSTFTEIFRALEKQQNIVGNITLHFGERSVSGANIANETALPQVKVFNKAYIDENIFTPAGTATSIFYLGQESIDKQKEVEKLKSDILENRTYTSKVTATKQQQERELDSYCIEKANIIKSTLRSNASGNTYNNYNKSNFKNKIESLTSSDESSIALKVLSDELYQAHLRHTNAAPKDQIARLNHVELDVVKLKALIVGTLNETVTSQVIKHLEENVPIAEWVKQGLNLHKTESGYSTSCAFCKGELKADRVHALEGHFNDAYNAFISKLDKNIESIDQRINSFRTFHFPEKSAFYDTHLVNYGSAVKAYQNILDSAISILLGVKAELEEKKKVPFSQMFLKTPIPDVLDISVAPINSIIDQNNADTYSFSIAVSSARTAIEEHFLASFWSEYKIKKEAIDNTTIELKALETRLSEITTKVKDIERSIREDLKPAEELNQDIRSYLGRDELKFTVKENGYELTRSSVLAENLSEGEKTAIAFLHFLKSLADKNFNLENGIVVIDDPISSLDSNSIYHAFGFLKEKTHRAGQLFILTHNHTFFRQVKNWFNHLKGADKKTGRFFMIQTKISDNNRQSIITPLDSLLHEFESEYHYLFSVVKNASVAQNGPLRDAYPLPNISRRLIETFLAFKSPNGKTIQAKIEETSFDTSKKNRILRFVHTYSHFDQISDAEHDPSILQESQAIMGDVLDFIKHVDEDHYNGMHSLLDDSNETVEG